MSRLPQNPVGARAYQLDREHVFHSWSVQGTLDPLTISHGEGCYLWDYDGKQYLDFSSQLIFANVGYQHPKLVAAIQEQAGRLATLSPTHAVLPRGEAAKAITDLLPGSHNKIFFTNGGADAVENAIRMARAVTGRRKVLSAYRSYHGNTSTAIMATGDQRRWPNEYASDHAHFFGPYLYRTAFNATTPEEECERALAHLRQVIELEGPPTIAALILESVVGSSGVLVPPPGYLQGVRDLCDEFGIIYIADEVMVGFGRTGTWFGFQHGLSKAGLPDLIVFAKGVNSGYLPLGGVIISQPIADHFQDKMFVGGLTYSGHPLTTASAVANIAIMHEEDIVGNADRVGNSVLGPALHDLAARHRVIGEVRGLGMFWALEFVTDPETRQPLPADRLSAITAACLAEGLLPFAVGNRIHVAPPLVATPDQITEGITRLDKALTAATA